MNVYVSTWGLRLVAGWYRQVSGSSDSQEQGDSQEHRHEEHSAGDQEDALQPGALVPADEGYSLGKKYGHIIMVDKVRIRRSS